MSKEYEIIDGVDVCKSCFKKEEDHSLTCCYRDTCKSPSCFCNACNFGEVL